MIQNLAALGGTPTIAPELAEEGWTRASALFATALVADLWETLLALVLGFLMAVYFFVQPAGFMIGGADGWC